ncbi:Transducin-like enhancer protein 4 [Xenotaenia resolanae]|uniref:Transducin-like enhancer protein 4 n=1 Tax=Xenotaenia resolanae TaxID=208358 RepID=A0ABV0WRM9_9TELE
MIRDLSKMYPPARHPVPHQPGQPFKFTVTESCDRIKEEFQFLQAQYHSLKLECEKLASEKTEMQRHYVMYYEMSYGLNIEMHKQVRCFLFLIKMQGKSSAVESNSLLVCVRGTCTTMRSMQGFVVNV